MRRKHLPLEQAGGANPEAKAKVALVLEVLSGERTISAACKETGLKPPSYYKGDGDAGADGADRDP